MSIKSILVFAVSILGALAFTAMEIAPLATVGGGTAYADHKAEAEHGSDDEEHLEKHDGDQHDSAAHAGEHRDDRHDGEHHDDEDGEHHHDEHDEDHDREHHEDEHDDQ